MGLIAIRNKWIGLDNGIKCPDQNIKKKWKCAVGTKVQDIYPIKKISKFTDNVYYQRKV